MSAPVKSQNLSIEISTFITDQIGLLDGAKFCKLQETAAKIHEFLENHSDYLLAAPALEAEPILKAVNAMLEEFDLRRTLSCKKDIANISMQVDNEGRLAGPDDAAIQLKKELAVDFLLAKKKTDLFPMKEIEQEASHIKVSILDDFDITVGFYYDSSYAVQSLMEYGKELQTSLALRMLESKACVIL